MSQQADKTREILRKVRQVEIQSRKFVTESLVGAYHSVFKGRGMDFEEVREYMPGDEVRTIDWNVTAKMDRPFVKTYKEERELTIMLVVDLSASGDFGSVEQSKRELAAELASVLAFSATRNNDKVGLLLFSDKIEKIIYPKKGRQHILRVIREILFFEPENRGTDIPKALNYVNHMLKRKAIVFLLSDFLTEESLAWLRPFTGSRDSLAKALNLTNRRHDLITIDLSDPRELELPKIGYVILEDAESGEQVEINTADKQVRGLYKHQNSKRRQILLQGFKQAGIDNFSISTGEPYIFALRKFFKKRGRRR